MGKVQQKKITFSIWVVIDLQRDTKYLYVIYLVQSVFLSETPNLCHKITFQMACIYGQQTTCQNVLILNTKIYITKIISSSGNSGRKMGIETSFPPLSSEIPFQISLHRCFVLTFIHQSFMLYM